MDDKTGKSVISESDRKFLDQFIEKKLAKPNWLQTGMLDALRIALEVAEVSFSEPETVNNFLSEPVAEIRFRMKWHGAITQPNSFQHAELEKVLSRTYPSRDHAVNAMFDYGDWYAAYVGYTEIDG